MVKRMIASFHLVHYRRAKLRQSWQGMKLLEGVDRVEAPNAPVAVLTRADIRLSKVPVFWLWTTHPAVTDVREAPGFVAGIAMTERPFVEVATFTLWRTYGDAMNFAYSRRAHQSIVARNDQERIMKAFSAAYFHLYRSAGTWRGQDPASVARRQMEGVGPEQESPSSREGAAQHLISREGAVGAISDAHAPRLIADVRRSSIVKGQKDATTD